MTYVKPEGDAVTLEPMKVCGDVFAAEKETIS